MSNCKGHVVIIVENLPVPFDRRVWMESTTLIKSGYKVSVICPAMKSYLKPYEKIEGIEIYRHRLPEAESTAGYFKEYLVALWSEWTLARKIFKKEKFQLIHACNPPDLIFLVAAWFKILHGTKFLFDHHDLNPELFESKFNKRGTFYHALLIVERLTFALADLVISTNESYKEIAITRGKKQPENVHVVRSGPKLDIFVRAPENPKYKNGRKFMIGYLGVMGEFDGVDHLVRCAHELIKNRGRKDIHFCLVGSGPTLNSLKALSKELDIEGYLEFTGRIPDKPMIEKLSTCDVCVNPDPLNPLNNKSTMNKILEYMALERPIVQYDLIEGRRSAEGASLYAEPNNIKDLATKIEDLLADPKKRAKMGALGRIRMENELEWKHSVPKLLRAYEQILTQ